MALFLKSDPEGDWILSITNVSAGEIMVLAISTNMRTCPFPNCKGWTGKSGSGLKERFGIELEPYVEPHDRDDTTARNSPERADNL